MPFVEVLPNSSAHLHPGWAYVPDTGYDPSKAPIVPSGARNKRAVASKIGSDATTSSRQNKAIISRLASLDKENYKDTQIPVPTRARPASRGKLTPNVRRILLSQRTFAHYLDAEEAQQTSHPTPAVTTLNRTSSTKATAAPSTPATAKHPTTTASTPLASRNAIKTEPTSAAPVLASAQPPPAAPPLFPPYNPNSDPLLVSHIPKPPSARVMEALLAEPALSYSATRARPSPSDKPARQFCEDCGYWGKVRCRKCGARTCGLMVCYKGHETGRCFYK